MKNLFFITLMFSLTACYKSSIHQTKYNSRFGKQNQRIYEYDYFLTATSLNNYYTGNNFSVNIERQLQKNERFDSAEVMNIHRVVARNNFAITAFHMSHSHTGSRTWDAYQANYLVHYGDKKRWPRYVKKADENYSKPKYLPIHASALKPCYKAFKVGYHYSTFTNNAFDNRDSYPVLKLEPITSITNKLKNSAIVSLFEDSVQGSSTKRYLAKYDFARTSITNYIEAYKETIIDKPFNNTLHVYVLPDFGRLLKPRKIVTLIEGPHQYYLSSWFYGFRNSCRKLWEHHFSLAIHNLENVSGNCFIENAGRVRRKRYDWKYYYAGVTSDRITAWKSYTHIVDSMNMAREVLRSKLEPLKQKYIDVVIKSDSSIMKDYFQLILEYDFEPEKIEFIKYRRRTKEKYIIADTGYEVEMKFYSKKWKSMHLLTFDVGRPYAYKIKEL